MRRIILVPLILFGVLLALVSFYYRMRNQKQLDLAIEEVSESPADAYQIFKPLMVRQGYPVLGQVDSAQDLFIDQLYDQCVAGLRAQSPGPQAYINAAQTIDILLEMNGRGGRSTTPFIRKIMDEARDSEARLETDGTYDAWNAMVRFFASAEGKGYIQADSKDSFREFEKRVASAALFQEVAWRDLRRHVQGPLSALLYEAAIPVQTEGRSIAIVLPPKLNDDSSIAITTTMGKSSYLLENYRRKFPDQHQAVLPLLATLIHCDELAMHVRYLGELTARPGVRPSSYVASDSIDPYSRTVPDPDQMFRNFVQLTYYELGATQSEIATSGCTEDTAVALEAFVLRGRILFDRFSKIPANVPEELFRQRMQQLEGIRNKTPLAAAIETVLQTQGDGMPFIRDLSDEAIAASVKRGP